MPQITFLKLHRIIRPYLSFTVLILLILTYNISSAKTWYINNSQGRNHLQNLINSASNGDVIYFVNGGPNNDYNMSGAPILVNKAITFQGFYTGAYNPNARGTSGITTNLTNVTSFMIRSNNVKFENIKITAVNNNVVLIDARSDRYNNNFTSPGYTANDQYSGIKFTNVELNGGFYSCFSGNGMQADFKNVAFFNFGRIGYINDRRTRVNGMKKVTFFRCKFKPVTPSGSFGFDSRGISLDAGNTSYPVVWHGNGTLINQCDFINTGVALSRVKNIKITGNTFSDTTAFVDMIHAEEFSNDILIAYNSFQCNAKPAAPRTYERSRIITLDSELQLVSNITVKNNTVTGEYNFFVNGYAPTNVSITNNNLSNAYPYGPNVIDFRYYENRYKTGEGIDANQEFTSKAITITGNTGFKNSSRGCQINVPQSGGAINIQNSQFVNGKVVRNQINNPVALRWSGIYEFANAGNTSRKLASNGNNFSLVTKANTSNNSTKWQITWVPPYYYHIKNVATGRYLETHKGYTEREILDQVSENVVPFLAYQNNDIPKWILRKTTSNGLFKLLPAGNEKQSVLVMSGINTKLIMHKEFNASGTRSVKEPNNFGRWWINPASGAKVLPANDSNASKKLTLFPNPSKDIVSIYYEDDAQPVIAIKIYDAVGTLVRKDDINSYVNNTLDISNLASGIYFVKSPNGVTQKLIVQ